MTTKRVIYQNSNSYETLNERQGTDQNLWFAFHGMGYLSRYFLKYFKAMDPLSNYIVAPQAPSKYYQGPDFKHVGASWLTREDTAAETQNVLNYIDAVFEAESLDLSKLILMGYSQGVSVVCRWMASRKIQPKMLVLHSGGIPVELTKADFDYLDPATPVYYIYGDKDQYITPEKLKDQKERGESLFDNRLCIRTFEGIHEVHTKMLNELAEKGRI
ncbi:alpha/beta hydrolase [Gilvibacter sediminis]|uniref:alpha/beta hydrolase n=1 Tax=Gilvibacter sediminis TaxID=379071 RepID=UPI0023501677|nr:esterase [Gilvibacter sediminis]MDC7999080.1 esterase [Gilvibacter sediminis]